MKPPFYILFFSFIVLIGTTTKAQTFTVTNTNDAGTGSLRQAMLNVMSSGSAGPFTITASAISGTINLASELPSITKSVTLTGPGASNLTVRRSSGGNYRIFVVPNGNHVVIIDGFTMANGIGTEGGAIYSSGVLTLANCVFRNNQATGTGGGGIWAANSLTINNCRFDQNSSSTYGGGVRGNTDFLSINNTTFSNNTADEGGGMSSASYNTVRRQMKVDKGGEKGKRQFSKLFHPNHLSNVQIC